MSSQQQPLEISGWQTGIADSPHVGNGLIRCADIETYPGAVKAGLKPQQLHFKINTVTFTADAASDLCTASGSIEANSANFHGAAVYFTTTGTLPAGLATGTIYFLRRFSDTTFKVCTSYQNSAGSSAGTVINITDAGTGTHTMNAVAIGIIKWFVKDRNSGNIFMLSSNGRVWFIKSGASRAYLLNHSSVDTPATGVAEASGGGLALMPFSNTTKTYLFVFRNRYIDVIDVYGDTAIEALGWTDQWANDMNNGSGFTDTHMAIRGQDDAIYYCDGRYIGSIIENSASTFDPSNAATYTHTIQALDLPSHEIAQCIEELDVNLLIGGGKTNRIYPWDRVSDSFDAPIIVPEKVIYQMKNISGQVYILAGTYGNIYYTQGTYVKFIKRIPQHVANASYAIQSNIITPRSIGESNGSLLIGVTAATSAASGVWKLSPGGEITHHNYPSTGAAAVYSILSEDIFFYMGYDGGADGFLLLQQYANYECVLQGPLSQIGNKTHKSAYHKLEVQIANPATSGSIRVSYRTNRTGSFTTLATFTADSASTSFMEDIGLTNLENIQVQVEMHGNPEFLKVILYP